MVPPVGEHIGSHVGRLTGSILDDIGSAIVAGRYAAHELLPSEMELSARFGTSRVVLREAMKVLTGKGLLSARRRRGTLVTPRTDWNLFDPDVLRWILRQDFSPQLLVEFGQVRLGVEPPSAGLAAAHAAPEQVAALRQALGRTLNAQSRGDALHAEIAFHLAVMDASRNPFYVRMKPFVEAAIIFASRSPEPRPSGDRELWCDVLNRIEAKDPAAATDAMRRLLEDMPA